MARERRVGGRKPAVPPDRFEVDLTSVCVRRGAVQLPYRLKGVFSEGPVAAVDADGGARVDLTFRSPRELAGLRSFFEAHALRANDRLALVFTESELRLEAIRRERSARIESEPRSRRAASPPSGGSPGGGDDATASVPSSRTDDGSAPRSAASPTPPSLRMVVPTASVPARNATDASREADGAPQPHWEPLDVLSRDAEGPETTAQRGSAQASAHTPGSVVVREVRRSAREPLPAESTAMSGATAGTGGKDEVELQASASDEREPLQETQRTRGAGLFGLGRRLGLGRSDVGRSGGSQGDEGGRRARSPGERGRDLPAPSGPERPGARGGGHLGSGSMWQAALQRGVDFETEAAPSDAARDRDGPAGAVEPDQPVAEGHRPGAKPTAVAAAPSRPNEQATVEEDMRAVLGYLAEPDVPAIVRTERIAEALGVSVARAERALERVSEGSEDLSRIRGGAYMLRRPKLG